MTTNDILNALNEVEGLKSAEITRQTELNDGASFTIVDLAIDDKYGERTITIPVIHYEGEDFIFTPWDWQSWWPETPDEIDQVTWRVNATGQEAVMMNGLPRIF